MQSIRNVLGNIVSYDNNCIIAYFSCIHYFNKYFSNSKSSNDNNLINNQNVGVINSQPVENYNEFNDGFNKFEEEFNSILPKKDIIDDGLLEDINNLSLDKTQKLDLIIPDLDDVELPRIGSIETEQKQIWKK